VQDETTKMEWAENNADSYIRTLYRAVIDHGERTCGYEEAYECLRHEYDAYLKQKPLPHEK